MYPFPLLEGIKEGAIIDLVRTNTCITSSVIYILYNIRMFS